jgi:ATP-binding cassette, subfamily B, multidrug efflux pump
MIRLAKYLKPYLSLIVISIALLFGQANADLALPDYLSRIVNNGIQQGGVENAAPTAIRASQMDRAGLFLSEDERARVLAAYTLVDAGAPTYAETLRTVPGVAGEPVYMLNKVSAEEIAWLSRAMGKSLLAVAGLEQAMADPTRAAQMGQAVGVDLSGLPAGVDPFTLLSRLPAAQRDQLSAAVRQQYGALNDTRPAASRLPEGRGLLEH